MFEGKKILITGGTGSLGIALTKKLFILELAFKKTHKLLESIIKFFFICLVKSFIN